MKENKIIGIRLNCGHTGSRFMKSYSGVCFECHMKEYIQENMQERSPGTNKEKGITLDCGHKGTKFMERYGNGLCFRCHLEKYIERAE